MSVNPIDDSSTPKTTGSLEELFRHHLGEEAAVPTRPMLWDQIDNSLLIRQNEVYRKRLVATRWVAAASLMLATLAGTGWWAGRNDLLGAAEMASNGRPAARGAQSGNGDASTAANNTRTLSGIAGQANQRSVAANATASNTAGAMQVGDAATGNGMANSAGTAGNGYAANRTALAATTPGRYTDFGPASAGRYRAGSMIKPTSPVASNNGAASDYAATDATAALAARTTLAPLGTSITNTAGDTNTAADASSRALAATGGAGLSAAGTTAAIGSSAAAGTSTGAIATAPMAAAAAAPEEMGMLAARQTSLAMANAPATLPSGLATVPVEELPAIDAHRWRYSASYAAGVFNPNINFSRAGIEPEFDYNRGPAFGTDSPALTETAATEYRNNLRSGLSQRIALLATRHLRGHWSLSTGAEFTQATAQSASSSAFVGEQLFDLGQGTTAQPLRTTDFRYRMASIPLEVRYSNPVKHGWSIYGRLGGVVTALLGVRSDVQGDPEATRTYSIASTGGPYRRLMGSVRGGAGAQFRPSTSKWAFSMGPTADLGLVALNAHPVQNYFAQSHPYSIGLEAAVEFGR
jgi:hypothetical protein